MNFGNLGFGEILVILVIVLLLFGAKRIPEIAGSLGKGINEFKRNLSDAQRQITDAPRAEQQIAPAAPANAIELRTEPDASGCVSACTKWSPVRLAGRSVPYQRPFDANAVPTTPRCGRTAIKATSANAPAASAARRPVSCLGPAPAVDFASIACPRPPRSSRPTT